MADNPDPTYHQVDTGSDNPEFNDLPYREKASELLDLLEADHVPPRVKLAVPSLSECHHKLFCMVGKSDLAVGTSYIVPGLYPSNLLCELLAACRASDWPLVMVLVQNATHESPSSVS